MRLIPRHRHNHRAKAPRISISQAEITADLHYPAGRRSVLGGTAVAGRRGVCDERRRERRHTAVDAALAFAETSPETSRSRTLVWQDPVPTAAAGATMTGIEYMEAIVAGEVPPPHDPRSLSAQG